MLALAVHMGNIQEGDNVYKVRNKDKLELANLSWRQGGWLDAFGSLVVAPDFIIELNTPPRLRDRWMPTVWVPKRLPFTSILHITSPLACLSVDHYSGKRLRQAILGSLVALSQPAQMSLLKIFLQWSFLEFQALCWEVAQGRRTPHREVRLAQEEVCVFLHCSREGCGSPGKCETALSKVWKHKVSTGTRHWEETKCLFLTRDTKGFQ